jgi:AGCS family alanine or glycine:cation symporter
MVQLSAVLDFSDAMIFVIAIPNLIALYLFAPEVKRDVTDYINRIKTMG